MYTFYTAFYFTYEINLFFLEIEFLARLCTIYLDNFSSLLKLRKRIWNINNMILCRPALRGNRSGNLSGSCRQGEGTPDNVEHVKRPNSISWKRDTQQDAPRPRGAPCPSCFHPCLLSRSGKSWSRRTPWDWFFLYRPFSSKEPTSFRVRRRDDFIKCGLIKLLHYPTDGFAWQIAFK